MISIEEALQLIQKQSVTTSKVERPLVQSLGYSLAEKVISPFDLPSFDNSAMDGYAIGGLGSSFKIIGEVAAGNTTSVRLEGKKAIRIFTGGKVPENTLAVIMQEHTDVEGTTLHVQEEIVRGKNIRRKGSEIAKGQEVFHPGHLITPATLGVLSSLGIATVQVIRKPTVQIISTGNELIEPGSEQLEGQIYESNSHSLSGALEDHGFRSEGNIQIKDDLEAIKTGISNAFERCDVLLLTGGISVGDYDFVKQALEENGVEEIFYKVFQKPGKPLYFGRKGNQFVFALPGNPASSLTCFYVYVLPLLQKLSGGIGEGLMRIKLPASHNYEVKFDRPTFLKARVSDQKVTILDGQGSSMIHSMASSNALVYIKGPLKINPEDLLECILI